MNQPVQLELIEVTHQEYELIFPVPYHLFNRSSFANLNQTKCDTVKYFLFKNSKYRLGFIGGIKNNKLQSPFSAPFGGFSFIKEDVQIKVIEEAVVLLEQYATKEKLSGIKMVLPPLFYQEIFLSKLINVLYRRAFQINTLDLDFYFKLQSEIPYEEQIWYNAKKNLRISQKQHYAFECCNDNAEKKQAVYSIIKANRAFKDKPMNMQYAEILATAAIIPTDFFLLTKENEQVAAAIVYHIADGILYVPYWGDMPGYTEYKPMNFLSYSVFEHYRKLGKQIVHIGISTEDSVPNYGLCEFKESIGCTITPKFSFEKSF
jgi:hypothetical protein